MVQRLLSLVVFGGVVALGSAGSASAQCGGCGYAAPVAPPVYAQPCCAQPVYRPVYAQPVYAQPVYAQPVYAQPLYAQQAAACSRPEYPLEVALDPSDTRCIAQAEAPPVYVVNQGPVYSGPNIAVAPAPYRYAYVNTQPYPYVPNSYYRGSYSGGPYADPIQHRAYRYHRIYQRHAYRYGARVLRVRD